MTYKYHVDGTLPQNGEIFVFGSNDAGIHGAGAAKVAMRKFGAQFGTGYGLVGQSYAIPTKTASGISLVTLPINSIAVHVNDFVEITKAFSVVNKKWFVTRVGCGLAGYKDSDIAPLFRGAENCSFAEEWKEFLE